MIFLQLTQQLRSLSNVLTNITDEQYKTRIAHLGNVSIGEHSRHIIELLLCAVNGYNTRVVDYVNRTRDLTLQNDKDKAQLQLQKLEDLINLPDQKLKLIVDGFDSATVDTTYFREVVYNTEHTIHHLALIKVALIDMKLDIVDEEFGMAYATLKYKAAIANDK